MVTPGSGEHATPDPFLERGLQGRQRAGERADARRDGAPARRAKLMPRAYRILIVLAAIMGADANHMSKLFPGFAPLAQSWTGEQGENVRPGIVTNSARCTSSGNEVEMPFG